jgi:hypothetical protein
MEETNRFAWPRMDKNRNAVGCKDGDGLTGMVGQKAVHALKFPSFGEPRNDEDLRSMDLLAARKMKWKFFRLEEAG